MNIAIRATENQKQELISKGFEKNVVVQWIEPLKKISNINADVFFDLVFNDLVVANNEFISEKPVFVNAVNCVCEEINRPNYIRLNAWNGFLDCPLTELSCTNIEFKKKAEHIFNELKWNFVWVADDYGFIAARILAMIINEAYYALEEKVSSKEQIDIAMKLGTNYPYGPFEWGEKIGLAHIYNLLQKLSNQDKRYIISTQLVYEYQQFLNINLADHS